jgi:type IV secretory pathway VirB6-like protein
MSFVLQPLVVSSFMIIMFSVFDQAFYTNCLYNSLTVSQSNGAYKKVFFLNTDVTQYSTPQVYAQCFTSLGGLLNYVPSLMVNGAVAAMQSSGTIKSANKTANGGTAYSTQNNPFVNQGQSQAAQPDSSPFVASQSTSQGIFIQTTTLIFEFLRDMIWSLFTCCVILYLMRYFAEQLANFAADITEGPSLGGSATAIYNKVNEIASQAGGGKGGGASGGGG